MIDCKNFKARKLADPLCTEAEVRAHAAHCPPCAQYAEKLEQFENRLRCSAVDCCGDVPSDLADRIIATHCPPASSAGAPRKSLFATLLDKLTGGGGPSAWFAPTMGAVTMTLLLGAAGLVALNLSDDSSPLARSLIAHVISEPGVFELQHEIPDDAVHLAFAQLGGRVEGSLGNVRHLGTCMLEGRLVHHLLLETPDGQATLMLVPGEAINADAQSDQGFSAAILPLPRGSLGIVTRSEDQAQRLKARLKQSVRVLS